MIDALMMIGLFMAGTILGSFAGAQVWRMRARQLQEDSERLTVLKADTSRSNNDELEYRELRASHAERRRELKHLQPLNRETTQTDRSRCLRCQHPLAWYDLLPIVSWISTGGRCRYCSKPIGWFELLIEAGLGVFFVLSYLLWPLPLDSWLAVAVLVVWLVASVPLVMLFAYDAKWYLLPDVPMIAFIGLAGVFAGLQLLLSGVTEDKLWSLLGAVAAIGGLYWVLHVVSGGRWVGYADAPLGVGLGLLLGQWPLAVLAVILANTIGTLIVLPALLTGKIDRQAHIPFGPLLITGAMLAFFAGQPLIDWYFALL